MNGFFNSSVGRKFAMALSALFLVFFLLIHVAVNLLSVFSEDLFNVASHFMGTNPLIQFAMQPILMLGVVFHFVMGFILELQNRKAQGAKYFKNNGAANSTWMSRNMVYSGGVILVFLIMHFKHFWVHEINVKYINPVAENATRYYEELVHVFQDPITIVVYIIGFVFLALHLLHGFQSAFQSMGLNNKYTKSFERCTKVYAILIPTLFAFVALFHHFNH